MTFQERLAFANRMENALIPFLKSKGFMLEKTGYEKYIPDEMRNQLRRVHNDPSVIFLRYLPDYFAIFRNNYFFIELKLMETPIRLDSRVEALKEKTGINDLSKENIGVVETAAVNNYKNLSSLGIKIMLIIYSTFNSKILLVDWEENLVKFYADKVRKGEGNASFTPFTNIHLDKMSSLGEFMHKEFNLNISEDEEITLIESIKK